MPRETDVYRETKGEDTDAPLAVASVEKQGRSSVPISQNQSVTRHLSYTVAVPRSGKHCITWDPSKICNR